MAEHLLDSDTIRRLERAKIILPVNFWDVTLDFLPHCMEESVKRKIGEIERKDLISEKGNIDDCFEQVREQSEEELTQVAKCLKKRL